MEASEKVISELVVLGSRDRRRCRWRAAGHEITDWRLKTLNWKACSVPHGVR